MSLFLGLSLGLHPLDSQRDPQFLLTDGGEILTTDSGEFLIWG